MVSNTSESDREIRKYLVWLLRSGDAHMTLDDAIAAVHTLKQKGLLFFPAAPILFGELWSMLEGLRQTFWIS